MIINDYIELFEDGTLKPENIVNNQYGFSFYLRKFKNKKKLEGPLLGDITKELIREYSKRYDIIVNMAYLLNSGNVPKEVFLLHKGLNFIITNHTIFEKFYSLDNGDNRFPVIISAIYESETIDAIIKVDENIFLLSKTLWDTDVVTGIESFRYFLTVNNTDSNIKKLINKFKLIGVQNIQVWFYSLNEKEKIHIPRYLNYITRFCEDIGKADISPRYRNLKWRDYPSRDGVLKNLCYRGVPTFL